MNSKIIDKYREPTIDECINGLEFELLTPIGYVKGFYPEVLKLNKELDQYIDNEMKLAHAITRVKI